eukprot:1198072-Alexandrium_andersonii.AAC.1
MYRAILPPESAHKQTYRAVQSNTPVLKLRALQQPRARSYEDATHRQESAEGRTGKAQHSRARLGSRTTAVKDLGSG